MIRKIRIWLWCKLVNFYPWWLQTIYKVNIGKGVQISWKAILDKNINPQGIHIGDYTKITKGVFILTHDGSRNKKMDVFIEDRTFLSVNSIILPGVTIGRGATVGAGSIVATNVPPYSIVMGNPAKVIGFKMKPLEILEYEKNLYPENERMSLEDLEKNYKKYYIDRIRIIMNDQK